MLEQLGVAAADRNNKNNSTVHGGVVFMTREDWRQYIQELNQKGQFSLDAPWIGEHDDWWPNQGRYYKNE